LQDEFKKASDQFKTTQTSLQQLRGAKKEADVQKKRQDALASLRDMEKSIADVSTCNNE
jgi:hypothetical protein